MGVKHETVLHMFNRFSLAYQSVSQLAEATNLA